MNQSTRSPGLRRRHGPTAPAARTLVALENASLRESVRDSLERSGAACLEATRAAEALERAGDPGVGVVLLDVALAGGRRALTVRRLLALRPALRLIVLGAESERPDLFEALRQGAWGWLALPPDPEALRLAVRRARAEFERDAHAERVRRRLRRLEAELEDLEGLGAAVAQDGPGALRTAAADAAARVLEATKSSLMLLDAGSAELRVVASAGRPLSSRELSSVPLGQSVAGVAAEEARTLLVTDLAADPRFVQHAAPSGRYRSDTFLVAPLLAGERVLGVLCATDPADATPFTPEDASLLEILALRVASLLARQAGAAEEPPAPVPEARDPGAVAEADAELARRVCEAASQESEPEALLAAVAGAVGRGLGAAPATLYLAGADGAGLRREAHWDGARRSDHERLPVGRGLTGTVLATGRMVATAQPETDSRFDAEVDTPVGGEVCALLCVPLRVRGRVLGVFRAFLPHGTEPAPRTGEVLAATLSAALRSVLLYRTLLDTIDEVAEARRAARPLG